ncbi:MAG: VOC family protein [bacterium]
MSANLTAHVVAYLCCDDAASAIDFYSAAFGAVEQSRLVMDDNRVGHAELQIGSTTLYLSDEWPEMNVRSPRHLGGNAVSFVLHVEDADVAFQRALAAGADAERPLTDSPHGYGGWLRDPWGHRWNIMSPSRGSA